ncbi:MAG: UvrB/UvrC motif-containing protein [Oscillospiraceae bacterium]|nr:UvrB/UvrC motif-containing protein [Oscillospiraceae bacterium]
MKCQHCGKNEVTFHYSSNINGAVTETRLCAECARQSGIDMGQMFTGAHMDDGFFPGVSGWRGGFASAFGFLAPRQFAERPQMGILNEAGKISEEIEKTQAIDEEMKKRREINAIREAMRVAAENDDFEKAAQLRDKIKELDE